MILWRSHNLYTHMLNNRNLIIVLAVLAAIIIGGLLITTLSKKQAETVQVAKEEVLATVMATELPELEENTTSTVFIDDVDAPGVVGYAVEVTDTYYHQAASEYVIAQNKTKKIEQIQSLLANNPDLAFIIPPEKGTQLMEAFGPGPDKYMWYKKGQFFFLSFTKDSLAQ